MRVIVELGPADLDRLEEGTPLIGTAIKISPRRNALAAIWMRQDVQANLIVIDDVDLALLRSGLPCRVITLAGSRVELRLVMAR